MFCAEYSFCQANADVCLFESAQLKTEDIQRFLATCSMLNGVTSWGERVTEKDRGGGIEER